MQPISKPITILQGDCLELLKVMAPNSVDAVVTDPPYHLTSITKRFGGDGAAPAKHGTDGAFARAARGFMGKQWDGGDISFRPETWLAVARVLKPGGYLLAFGGTRTMHRITCAIEDAGFEIRDQLGWLYGSGFPKSHDAGEGRGTALKPAQEPICMARKPLDGTVAVNIALYGTGALNIDSCLVGGMPDGRWPANIIHDGSKEVLSVFPSSKGQQGVVTGEEPSALTDGIYGEFKGRPPCEPRGDTGSAARFFYCAKASKADREEGLEHLPIKTAGELTGGRKEGSAGLNSPRAGAGRTGGRRNTHPTVKPTELMRYLCRLVTPPGGIVLDPFAGSGSTGKAAKIEGFRFIGIERDPEYVTIARARLQLDTGLLLEDLVA